MRRAVVRLGDSAAQLMFNPSFTFQRVVDGVPPGAKLVGVERLRGRGVTLFVFEHESFDDIADGEIYPQIVMEVHCVQAATIGADSKIEPLS